MMMDSSTRSSIISDDLQTVQRFFINVTLRVYGWCSQLWVFVTPYEVIYPNALCNKVLTHP